MEKFTCIMCPVGCSLEVEKIGKEIKVFGNACIRGERYGKTELTNPTRMITALVKTKNGFCAVKTSNLVPKSKIFDVLAEIKTIKVDFAIQGQILISNVCGLNGVDIIVTRE